MRYKIAFILPIVFLAADLAFASTDFNDLINKRLQEQEKTARTELKKQGKLIQKKELEKQLKKPIINPALIVDLKIGTGLTMSADAAYHKPAPSSLRFDSYEEITPRFELNTIYFINKYIGIGIGCNFVNVNFNIKNHFYGNNYWYETINDWSAAVHGIISGRTGNITAYLAAGMPNEIGCGIDYSISNVLIGLSGFYVKTEVAGWDFDYSIINLTAGYRFNILSKYY